MRIKISKQPPPAPTASAIGPCPTGIQIVGRPGTGSLLSTFAPPDHLPILKREQGWTLLAQLTRAAEDRTRWKGIFVKSPVAPQRLLKGHAEKKKR